MLTVSRPHHERVTANTELPSLHLAMYYIVKDSLLGQSKHLWVLDLPRIPINETIKILLSNHSCTYNQFTCIESESRETIIRIYLLRVFIKEKNCV